ncbi:MAG: hypothetical protein ACEY26_00640 [Candidatus Hodgkinia cicadicola]
MLSFGIRELEVSMEKLHLANNPFEREMNASLKFLTTAKVIANVDGGSNRLVDPIDDANAFTLIDWASAVPSFTVSVASICSPEDRGALEKFATLGAAEVIQLPFSCQLDSLVKAKLLKDLVLSRGFSLVALGAQSSDVGSAQVGLILAGLLNWPCITGVTAIVHIAKAKILVRRSVGNVLVNVFVQFPCILSTNLNRNEFRSPSLLPPPSPEGSPEVKPITIEPINKTNFALSSQIKVLEEFPIINARLGLTFGTLNSTLEAFARWFGVAKR